MLIDAISQSLHRAYPNETIYTERIVKGMAKPCFSLLAINTAHRELIGNRYQTNWLMMVRYFPRDDGSESSYAELHELAQNLYGVLDEVRYSTEGQPDDIYFGYGMTHRIEDNVLHFQVSYNFWLKKQFEPVEKMQQLEITVKAGERL